MRFKTDHVAVWLGDAHLEPWQKEFHPAYKVAREYTLDIRPEILVIGGDFGTFDSLSGWNQKKPLLAENKRYKDEVDFCKDELYRLANDLHNSRRIFILGNHEQRARWFVEKYPAMAEWINITENLELDKLGFEVVAFEDYIEIGELAWTHGWYWNKYHANKTLEEFGGNVMYGHVHHFQSNTRNIHFKKKQLIAQSIGCLTDRYPVWKGNKPTRFQNGFATVEYQENGRFNIVPHIIFDGTFSYGGYTWKV